MKVVGSFKQKLKVGLILLIIGLMHFQYAYSQENSCAFLGSENKTLRFGGIKFFDETLDCNPLTLKCNFVIIRRDNGTGNLDPSSPFWGEWEQQMNDELANITDKAMCSTGYPLDSKVRVKFEVHTIYNMSAWDWYAKANADNHPSTSSPNKYICPRFQYSWPALEDAMTSFEQAHFGEINFFFTDNGALVDTLEKHIFNNSEPSEPYVDRFSAAGNRLASGCAIFPKSYFSQANQNSYVIANTYSDYLIRKNFHHIWWPEYANESPETVWSWAYNSKKILFLHELGHNVINMGHDNSCRQLMSTNWEERTNHITKAQLENLHRTLATKDLHNAVDCSKLDDVCPVQVVSNETLTEPMSVFGDLIIKSGVTFIVKSSIFFSENSKVIVEEDAKFIVDGGLLTNGCGLTWEGIKVYGGNSDFDVKFTNGATIENTNQAAVSMFAPEPWPQITNWGNGILQADNTTFNNTRRIVEFMSWSPLPNPSYIRKCVQNGGKWSITNWNCQNIEVRDNVFNNITNECIVTETGSFTIIGNEFNSGQNDILFNNVSAGISTKVSSNLFYGINTGYNARGTTFAQNEINSNIFQTGFIGVMNDGHNHYMLGNNYITATFGAATFDGGSSVVDVYNNDFSGNFAGALPIGDNGGYNFFENCYNTTFVDNQLVGKVSSVIHKNSGAAYNCFTHNGSQNSVIQDLGGDPDFFTYFEPTDSPIDCQNAILAHINVNCWNTNGPKKELDCGPNLQVGGTTNWNYCWPKRSDKNHVLEAYNWLMNKLNEIDNDSNLSEEQKEWFKQIYVRCFKRVRGYLFEIYVKGGSFDEARDLFATETHEDAKIYIYSSYIMENNLLSAREYLNSISTENEQMQDFVTIQHINLDRIPYGPYYEVSGTEINTVLAIALKSHPYAGYAKALYYSLTGEVINSEIPEIRGHIHSRNSTDKIQSSIGEFKVYPNPFSSDLNIDVIGYDEVSIFIMDFFGRTVYTTNTNQSVLNINTDTWHQGMYLIRIESNGEIVHTNKILLVH